MNDGGFAVTVFAPPWHVNMTCGDYRREQRSAHAQPPPAAEEVQKLFNRVDLESRLSNVDPDVDLSLSRLILREHSSQWLGSSFVKEI